MKELEANSGPFADRFFLSFVAKDKEIFIL